MKLSGVLPLRNGVLLSYPFELAIRSLQAVCDEVIVLVDPTSEDDTLAHVRALAPTRIVESVWDMDNHGGHQGRSEIARQTAIACAAATGDWILSLQADEVFDAPGESAAVLRAYVDYVEDIREASAISLLRIYFYGGLDRYREDWTVPCTRLFARGRFRPDPYCGAMQFLPVEGRSPVVKEAPSEMMRLLHYSRVGDPLKIALRVRNLDTFYWDPSIVAAPSHVSAYDFSVLRKLDTYVLDTTAEPEPSARLLPFPIDSHPVGVREFFGE